MSLMNAPVGVTLDRERNVLYSLGACARIKRSTGRDPIHWQAKELGEALQESDSFNAIASACLAHEDPKITPESIGDILSSVAMINALQLAIFRSFFRFCGQTDEQIDAIFEQAEKQGAAAEAVPAVNGLPPLEVDPLTAQT